MTTNGIKLLRMNDVLSRVAYKSSSIYQKIKDDKFPKPRIQRRGFTAWYETDIDLFLVYLEQEDASLTWSHFLDQREASNG